MIVGSDAAGKSRGPGIVGPVEEDEVPPHAATTNINDIINVVIFFIKSPLSIILTRQLNFLFHGF
jgi:hypothetical protein